ATAGKLVKKGLTSPKSDIKQAAEALNAAAQKEIATQASQAKADVDRGAKWDAYRAYLNMNTRFQGFDLPEEVTSGAKKLPADPQVKAGMAALKTLDAANRLPPSTAATSRKRGLAMLDKIAQDMPGTDLATEAKSLMEQYK